MEKINPNKYKELLPLYLKKGHKVGQWLDFLGSLTYNYQQTFDGIFDVLTFHNNVAFNSAGSFVGPKADGYRFGLETVSKWFGIYREFKADIINTSTDAVTPQVLYLSDREMYRLIKTQLWKIGFDGTTESLESNLNNTFEVGSGTQDLQIYIYKNTSESAAANILAMFAPGTFSSNDFDLWVSGYYNNPVIGIKYTYTAVPNNQLMYDFDLPYDDGKWDDGIALPTSKPNLPSVGDMWFDKTAGLLYTCVAEDTWTDAASEEMPTTPIPSSARWFDESTNRLHTWMTWTPYIYDGIEIEEEI